MGFELFLQQPVCEHPREHRHGQTDGLSVLVPRHLKPEKEPLLTAPTQARRRAAEPGSGDLMGNQCLIGKCFPVLEFPSPHNNARYRARKATPGRELCLRPEGSDGRWLWGLRPRARLFRPDLSLVLWIPQAGKRPSPRHDGTPALGQLRAQWTERPFLFSISGAGNCTVLADVLYREEARLKKKKKKNPFETFGHHTAKCISQLKSQGA